MGEREIELSMAARTNRDAAIARFFDRAAKLLDRLEPVIVELEHKAAEENEQRKIREVREAREAPNPQMGDTMRPRRFQ